LLLVGDQTPEWLAEYGGDADLRAEMQRRE